MTWIECGWGRTRDFSHLHSIRLLWSMASELGLNLQKRVIDFNTIVVKIKNSEIKCWIESFLCELNLVRLLNAIALYSKSEFNWNSVWLGLIDYSGCLKPVTFSSSVFLLAFTILKSKKLPDVAGCQWPTTACRRLKNLKLIAENWNFKISIKKLHIY